MKDEGSSRKSILFGVASIHPSSLMLNRLRDYGA
jgi:hypothetical protein